MRTGHRGSGALVRRVVVALALVVAVPLMTAPAGATEDPLFVRQWPLERIGAPDPTATGTDVLIGLVDTGVDMAHPDLQGKVAASAVCLEGPCREGGAQDDNGHGTEVAGIAVATAGNRRGIAGVAPDAKLLVAKVLDSDGAGRVDDINAGIRWVVDNGAKVVNLSLGDPDFLLTSLVGTPLRPGIEYAWTRGAVPVLASGNYRVGVVDQGSSNYGDVNALVVGATDRNDAVAPYSTAIGNAKWGMVAPGGIGPGGSADDNVITTILGGGYGAVAGTSLSTPHVSGAVASVLGLGLSPTAAVERVLATLDKSVSCGAGCKGRLDVRAAVAGGGPPATTATTVAETADGSNGSSELEGEGTAQSTEQAADDADDDDRNPVVIGVAIALIVATGAAAGGVSLSRAKGG